jgi:hypothetical protein
MEVTRKTATPLPPLPPPGADTASTGDGASVHNNRYTNKHILNDFRHFYAKEELLPVSVVTNGAVVEQIFLQNSDVCAAESRIS